MPYEKEIMLKAQEIGRLAQQIEEMCREHMGDYEFERVQELAGLYEKAKPSAGMTKAEKSAVVKKARAGRDIGKPGPGFAKVEKQAAKYGARDPKAVAAAAMWKQQAKK